MRWISYIFVILIAILVMTEVFWHRKKSKKKDPDEIIPPVFDIYANPMPVYKNCDICVSDFIEERVLFQIHCTDTYGGQIARGFCSNDLFQFEKKVRAEIRNAFDRLGDNQTDRTVKIWYQNPDDRKFDTNDIPLKVKLLFSAVKYGSSDKNTNKRTNGKVFAGAGGH